VYLLEKYIQFLQNCHKFKRISVSPSYYNYNRICFVTLFLITIRLRRRKRKRYIHYREKFCFLFINFLCSTRLSLW